MPTNNKNVNRNTSLVTFLLPHPRLYSSLNDLDIIGRELDWFKSYCRPTNMRQFLKHIMLRKDDNK